MGPCGPPSWTNQWQLGPNQAPQGCPGPSGAPKGAFLGQNGPFWGPRECCRSSIGPEHLIWMRPTQLDQTVALGPKLGPPGLPKDLWGPQKGLSGPKRALLGAQECRDGLVRGL